MRVPRRLVALALVAGVLVLAAPRPARAGGAAEAALALAAFAVFTQFFWPPFVAAERTTIVYAPPAYAPPVYTAGATPAVVHAPSVAPAPPPVVEYPHGRWELRGDGVSLAYHWVWIPKAPPAPPPVPPPPPGPPPAAPPAR